MKYYVFAPDEELILVTTNKAYAESTADDINGYAIEEDDYTERYGYKIEEY